VAAAWRRQTLCSTSQGCAAPPNHTAAPPKAVQQDPTFTGSAASAHITHAAGNNHLNKLDRTFYLRQFNNLESVNLAGNPICREANYKSYLLSHIKSLKYLDYVRVNADDVMAAIEHHQDEVLPFLLLALPLSLAQAHAH
jgi:hypothetical protein